MNVNWDKEISQPVNCQRNRKFKGKKIDPQNLKQYSASITFYDLFRSKANPANITHYSTKGVCTRSRK